MNQVPITITRDQAQELLNAATSTLSGYIVRCALADIINFLEDDYAHQERLQTMDHIFQHRTIHFNALAILPIIGLDVTLPARGRHEAYDPRCMENFANKRRQIIGWFSDVHSPMTPINEHVISMPKHGCPHDIHISLEPFTFVLSPMTTTGLQALKKLCLEISRFPENEQPPYCWCFGDLVMALIYQQLIEDILKSHGVKIYTDPGIGR